MRSTLVGIQPNAPLAEHGPFFAIEPSTSGPVLRPNGAVEYLWHGWQAGDDDGTGQAFDFVAAFETYPDFVAAK